MACVARETSYSYKRVKYWVDHYKKHGNVTTRKPSGRPRLISTAAARAAVELLADSDNYGTAQVVAAELHQRGLTPGNKPVHKTTLIRAAVAQATTDGDPLEVASGEPEKELTAATKQKRMEFCQANLSTNWAQIMFTDRKKFAFRYPGTKHRGKQWIKKSKGGKKGKRCFKPNNPQRVNLYMGINKWGVTKVHKVSGSHGLKTKFKNKKNQDAKNITSDEYAHVLKETFLPEGRKMFSAQGMSNWKLQQDNDPTHKKAAAAEIAAWNAAHPGQHVQLLPNWPPNSPDLSPIENVWGIVQRQVDSEGCSNFAQFEALVIKKLQQFDKKVLKNMYKTMGERIKLCIAASGDRISY